MTICMATRSKKKLRQRQVKTPRTNQVATLIEQANQMNLKATVQIERSRKDAHWVRQHMASRSNQSEAGENPEGRRIHDL